MKNILFHIFLLMLLLMPLPNLMAQHQPASDAAYNSPTEGVIDHKFIPESQMMDGILQMMAKFSPYLVKNFVDEGLKNKYNENYAGFRSVETMFANEDGIRTVSDLGMAAAFLFKYGSSHNIQLPEGITYQDLYKMAMRSLVFVYSTHRSNVLARSRNNAFWGSIGTVEQFESSLWAMGMAYQAYMLWDSLQPRQIQAIKNVLVAESDFVLHCPIRCRFVADTRAEENGWDVGVLAAMLGLFPEHANANHYFKHMRLLAINTLSHVSDKKSRQIIDPDIDTLTVGSAYVANNLFNDYTLQNHERFHPGYQNVVLQELGEAALALEIFQQKILGYRKYHTNALFHNCKEVQDSVLHYLALPDGELAMPNGNDWSMYLFDQITSYATMSCFLKDPDALMLENQAYKNLRARQQTTPDGSWMLLPDVGARRMGVQAHRVLMVYLMHQTHSTARLRPTSWNDFYMRHQDSKFYKPQMLVRAASPSRTMFFSLAPNLDVSGYFAPNTPDKCKIVIPMPNKYGTGNFLGWYKLNNNYTRTCLITNPRISLENNSFAVSAEYYINSYYLTRRHALYCTPGNAIISLDMVRNSKGQHKIYEEQCGALAISFDPFTSTVRRLYHENGCDIVADTASWERKSGWLNIDNTIGIISFNKGKLMRLSKAETQSSINTRVLSMSYSRDTVAVGNLDIVGRHAQVYLSNVSASQTRQWQQKSYVLDDYMPHGWMGIVCCDGQGTYVVLSNFYGEADSGSLQDFPVPDAGYFPVLRHGMQIADNKVSSKISLSPNSSEFMRAGFMIRANNVSVDPVSDTEIRISASQNTRISLAYSRPGDSKLVEIRNISLPKDSTATFHWDGRKIRRRP